MTRSWARCAHSAARVEAACGWCTRSAQTPGSYSEVRPRLLLHTAHSVCVLTRLPRAGNVTCEICKRPAWRLSEEALREAAAKRAAEAARRRASPLAVPGAQARRADPMLFMGGLEVFDAQHAARVRLVLADVSVLLAIIFTLLYEAAARQAGWNSSRHILNLFIALVVAALLVSVFRARFAQAFRWFHSRLGTSILTLTTLIALVAFVANFGVGWSPFSAGDDG